MKQLCLLPETEIATLEQEAARSDIPGFFPTPRSLAERLVRKANIAPGTIVLEPSAGSGAIADAARHAEAKVRCIEVAPELVKILRLKGHNAVCADFMSVIPRPVFDAVLMNPPFCREIGHTRRAWSWLKPGGTLAAIVSPGIKGNPGDYYRRWRCWFDSLGAEVEKLPSGSFRNSLRPVGIDTYLVIARKKHGIH